MPRVKKREDNLDKISMKFDVPMLNTLVQYMLCENVSGIQLSRVNTLMKQIDTSDYEYNSDILLRLKLLKLLSEAVVENNIRDKNILRDFILTKEPDVEDILKDVSPEYNTLNESECKYVANAIIS